MRRALWPLLAALVIPQAPEPPLTAGAVALLVKRSDAQYRPMLQRAIADRDPVVRALAARVAAVRRQGDLRDALQGARAAETDELAAREQSRALAVLQHVNDAATPVSAAAEAAAVHSLPLFAPGILSSLAAEAGCKPGKYGAYGAARVTFAALGLPGRIEMDASALSPQCRDLFEVALLLTVAEDSDGMSSPSVYFLLPLDDEFVRCSDATPVAGTPLSGPPQPPHKTRDVKPKYPERAQAARVSGTVIAQAMVTTTGCVAAAKVTKGVSRELDFEALRAVIAWRFEPARIGGSPVPFMLTVTVNFELR